MSTFYYFPLHFEFICRTPGVCFAKYAEKLGSCPSAMRTVGSKVWKEAEKMGTEAFLAVPLIMLWYKSTQMSRSSVSD